MIFELKFGQEKREAWHGDGPSHNYTAPGRAGTMPEETPTAPPPPALPSVITTGFYMDDEQIGWELGGEFETPKSVCFMIAHISPQDKDRYDVIEYRLPLQPDQNGLLSYNHNRSYIAHKTYNGITLSRAIHELAAFANPSLKSLDGYTNRPLPRMRDDDAAFQSFLDAVNFQIGEHELSDMPTLPKIENVVADPSMEENLPAILSLGTGGDADLTNSGLNFHFIKPLVTCRENPDTSPFAFRMETLKRQVTKKSVQADIPKPATPQLQIKSGNVPYREAGLLSLIFKYKSHFYQDYFNEYFEGLQRKNLEIIDYKPFQSGKSPLLNGTIEIVDKTGTSIKFDTVLKLRRNAFHEFRIGAHGNAIRINEDTAIVHKNPAFITGFLGSKVYTVAYAGQMAEKTSELFNRMAAMNEVGFADILETVRSYIEANGFDIPRLHDDITSGPLAGHSWADIGVRLAKVCDTHLIYKSLHELFIHVRDEQFAANKHEERAPAIYDHAPRLYGSKMV